jgi:hypothetical protein
MKAEPSLLARLVIAYYKRLGRHVPEPALRRVDAGLLAALLQDSLATGVPISEGEFGWFKPPEYRRGGCILRDENPDRATPKREPDGEWLQ